MCHSGCQQLFTRRSVQGIESPKETVYRLIKDHKSKLDKVTIVGQSLGGGEKAQEKSATTIIEFSKISREQSTSLGKFEKK